jgi:hypothetical protein
VYWRDPQGNAATRYDILSIVTAGVYRTTWWSHTNCHFKTVMTEVNSHGRGMHLIVLIKFFHFVLKSYFIVKTVRCLIHSLHTTTHWINFALFVGEITSGVIVSTHILCVVEYSCQRTCHVKLGNGLQISEMLQCSWFYSRHCNSTQKFVLCPRTTVGHRLWDIQGVRGGMCETPGECSLC